MRGNQLELLNSADIVNAVKKRKQEIKENDPRQSVKQLLNSKDEILQKETILHLRLPEKIQKRIKKSEEEAIKKIAFQEIRLTIRIVNLIFAELNQKLDQKSELRKTFSALWDEIQKLNENNSAGLDELKTILQKKAELSVVWRGFYTQLNENSYNKFKLSDEVKTICNELRAWLDGMHLHFCINASRNEANRLLDEGQQSLVPNPIRRGYDIVFCSMGIINADEIKKVSEVNNAKLTLVKNGDKYFGYGFSAEQGWKLTELDKKFKNIVADKKLNFPQFNNGYKVITFDQIPIEIYEALTNHKIYEPMTAGKEAAIKYISSINAEDSVLIILSIVNTLLEKSIGRDGDKEHSDMTAALVYVLREMTRGNDIQNYETSELTSYLNANKNRMLQDVQTLAAQIASIKPRAELQKIYNEFELWLMGYYYETYKKANSAYYSELFFHGKNTLVKRVTGSSLLDLANEYWPAIRKLKDLAVECRAENEIEQDAIPALPPSTNPIAIPGSESSSTASSVSSSGARTDNEDLLQMEDFEEVIIGTAAHATLKDMDEEDCWLTLNTAKDSDDRSIKITSLFILVSNYKLSLAQIIALSNLKNLINTKMAEYENINKGNNSYIGAVKSGLTMLGFRHDNSSTKKKILDLTRNLDKDPQAMLYVLYDAKYLDLVNTGSQHLLPFIDDILADIWTILYNQAKAQRENKQQQQQTGFIQQTLMYSTLPYMQTQQFLPAMSVTLPPSSPSLSNTNNTAGQSPARKLQ